MAPPILSFSWAESGWDFYRTTSHLASVSINVIPVFILKSQNNPKFISFELWQQTNKHHDQLKWFCRVVNLSKSRFSRCRLRGWEWSTCASGRRRSSWHSWPCWSSSSFQSQFQLIKVSARKVNFFSNLNWILFMLHLQSLQILQLVQ